SGLIQVVGKSPNPSRTPFCFASFRRSMKSSSGSVSSVTVAPPCITTEMLAAVIAPSGAPARPGARGGRGSPPPCAPAGSPPPAAGRPSTPPPSGGHVEHERLPGTFAVDPLRLWPNQGVI